MVRATSACDRGLLITRTLLNQDLVNHYGVSSCVRNEPMVCSVCRNDNPVLSSFMTCHMVCNKSNTTGPTSGIRLARSLVFYVMYCRYFFVNFLLVIVLSILRFTDPGYPIGNFKLYRSSYCYLPHVWEKKYVYTSLGLLNSLRILLHAVVNQGLLFLFTIFRFNTKDWGCCTIRRNCQHRVHKIKENKTKPQHVVSPKAFLSTSSYTYVQNGEIIDNLLMSVL